MLCSRENVSSRHAILTARGGEDDDGEGGGFLLHNGRSLDDDEW
jgi:hypothetical protein